MEKGMYTKMAYERLRQGDDLFSHAVVVIPVKTHGRSYGSVSREAVSQGWEVPSFERVTNSELRRMGGRTAVFVALWDDVMEYSDALIARCVMSCINTAALSGCAILAFPLFGGKDKVQYIAAMEKGVEQAEEQLDAVGLLGPKVLFVTNGTLA